MIHDVIAREKGLFQLGEHGNYDARSCDWFLNASDTDDALDFIEVSFRVVDRMIGSLERWQMQNEGVTCGRADASKN